MSQVPTDDPSPPPAFASGAPAAAPVSRRRRLTLGVLGAVFAAHFLDRQLLAILIPPIQAELGLSDTALGLLSGLAFTVFFSVVGLAIARLADRYDRARIITVSLALFSAMTALCGLATGFWQLLAARIGVGVGEGGTNPPSHALIADLYPSHQRAAAMAAYSVGPHAGVLLAFGLGGWLAHAIGWRATFVVAGLAGLALALVTQLVLRDPRAAERHARPAPSLAPRDVIGTLARARAMRHLFAAATLALATTTGALTWLPALLVGDAGVAVALLLLPALLSGAYLGPTLALVQDGVDARARAFSSALLLFVVNLVGASAGPLAIGMLSDLLAPSLGAPSLARAMLVVPLFAAWSAWHFRAAMRAAASAS